ncbi:ABC transporter permease [Bradyrhizobium roseum]|uniref:ABC transporter permease n=1 Tax=Bradyrhizobium roseum TaxID=3056648 RepID=UPI00260D2E3E|nr:ABC transporter permease [Bradyrhizobium roseus]WKA26316.1 ABC transporter permease [Bradyrhizobium roseus]
MSMADTVIDTAAAASHRRHAVRRIASLLAKHPAILIGGAVLLLFIVIALLAPLVLPDPLRLNPLQRLRTPSLQDPFGTDQFGRSTLSRTLNGTRISLTVGILVAIATTVVGLLFGLLAGFLRRADNVIMRLMDGIMAIPGILLAIALMSLFGSSVQNVVVAISIAEIPRMARVVRSSVLVIREQPYVEAAVTNGTKLSRLLWRHVLPNIAAPVIVQATYVFASAMIVESVLSFLGAGTPPTIPSWGNMLAEGRQYLQRGPWMIAFPGACLALLVLTVNVLGDALRDALDPRLSRSRR